MCPKFYSSCLKTTRRTNMKCIYYIIMLLCSVCCPSVHTYTITHAHILEVYWWSLLVLFCPLHSNEYLPSSSNECKHQCVPDCSVDCFFFFFCCPFRVLFSLRSWAMWVYDAIQCIGWLNMQVKLDIIRVKTKEQKDEHVNLALFFPKLFIKKQRRENKAI